jgi:hypothetical protein
VVTVYLLKKKGQIRMKKKYAHIDIDHFKILRMIKCEKPDMVNKYVCGVEDNSVQYTGDVEVAYKFYDIHVLENARKKLYDLGIETDVLIGYSSFMAYSIDNNPDCEIDPDSVLHQYYALDHDGRLRTLVRTYSVDFTKEELRWVICDPKNRLSQRVFRSDSVRCEDIVNNNEIDMNTMRYEKYYQ